MSKLVAITLLLAATTVASADNLEERKYWKTIQKNADDAAKKAGKACDTEFTVEFIDKPKFREEAAKTKHNPGSICQNMVDRVLMLCREGEDEKASVKAKIKAFQCGFSPERTLDIKNGTLIYLGNHTQANFADWAKPALTKKL